MLNIKCVVFDLDGTLVDSAENIYQATIQSFDSLNIHADFPKDKFNQRIGHHFEDIFNEFRINVGSFDSFIDTYKDLYLENIHHSSLYPGVIETIEYLHNNGFMIALLTTKNQDQADMIIDHFGFREQFNYVMGRRPGLKHKPSAEPLLKICEDLQVNPENVLMTGDTQMDIQCGKNAGAKTCAVTYGYRSKKLLDLEKPDIVIDRLIELTELIH